MTGRYELNPNDKGQYPFVLKASTAEVILHSDMYQSAVGRAGGIESVKTGD